MSLLDGSFSCGPLPGLLQTIGRAEMSAALSAVKWAVMYSTSISLWIDALNVARGLVEIQAGEFRWDSHADRDLWDELSFWVRQMAPGQLWIQHVPAHLDQAKCDGSFDECIARCNQWADTVAVQVNLNRSEQQTFAHHHAFSYHSEMLGYVRACRSMYFHIAGNRAPVRSSEVLESGEDVDPPQPCAVSDPGDSFSERLPLGWKAVVRTQASRLPCEFVVGIFEFLLQQETLGDASYQVTWPELTVILCEVGVDFPVCAPDGSWVTASSAPFLDGRHTFAVQIRLVREAVGLVFKTFNSEGLTFREVSIAGLGFAELGVVLLCVWRLMFFVRREGFFPILPLLVQSGQQLILRVPCGADFRLVGLPCSAVHPSIAVRAIHICLYTYVYIGTYTHIYIHICSNSLSNNDGNCCCSNNNQ